MPHDIEAGEQSSLLGGHDASETDAAFVPLLDQELRKITLFYELQEKEFFEELEELEEAIKKQEEADITGEGRYEDFEDMDDDEDDDESVSRSPDVRRHAPSSSVGPFRRATIRAFAATFLLTSVLKHHIRRCHPSSLQPLVKRGRGCSRSWSQQRPNGEALKHPPFSTR